MPTTESGKPALNGQPKSGFRYEMVAKLADDAMNSLIAFDEINCEPIRITDLDGIKRRTKEYIMFCQQHCSTPTFTGLSARLGITQRTLNEWLKDSNYPETQQYLRFVKTVFADMLEQGALNGANDKIFSMFLLKSVHDYQETNKVVLEAKPNQYGEELSDEQIASIVELDEE